MESSREEKTIKSAFDSTTFDTGIQIHVEKDATDIGSATISPSGRDVAIASKTGLDIIDLDSPLNPPRHLKHWTSWNVADVQWSPFAARDYWICSTSNQKALVWNLSMPEDAKQGAIEHTLHAHARAITDINFSAHHPDILSTCAVDGYVHCWDLRRPRRPVMTFVDWDAGATQVKWNRVDGHVLASSHDRWLRIWDDRKGAYPLRSIEAHTSKIYGVDWNRTRATGIVTCSLDKSIKFWDVDSDEDIPEQIIRTNFPVWRARHTPFGWGLLAMPQNSPGNLHLYDRRKRDVTGDESSPAIAIFPGHGDKQVKEFLWRSRGEITEEGIDNREFQLVSWGDDKELRLQKVPTEDLKAVGFVRGSHVRQKLNLTRKGAIYRTFRNIERIETEKKYVSISGPRRWSAGHESPASALSDGMKRMSPSKRYRSRWGPYASTMKDKSSTMSENRNQINWMSGIKFSKTGTNEAARSKAPPGRRLSLISPNFDIDESWDAPETLHDEIIRVHEQYSKVTFNDVNMDKRSITVSMNGPWGEGGDSVFIKVNIDFPDQYPEAKVPNFTVGKSSLISDKVYEKINREVHQIASNFVGRRRGCLEAAICYFLGEVDLEESSLWFATDGASDDLDGLADESSSEDEDSDLPVGVSMSQELDSSATGAMLAPTIRHANVPLPRVCGARFAMNGKLVCFFPPKEEKFKSLLGSVNLEKSRYKGEQSFNTFSRLKSDVLLPRSKFSVFTDEDEEDSDSSQKTDSSSSSDSDSSQFHASVAFDFWRKVHGSSHRKKQSTNRSQKSSAAGTGTGTGTATSRGRFSKPKVTVSIHNIRTYTPVKRELAEEYAFFGDGLEVCTHNAIVAAKYGYQDRADIWTYVGMLLQHEVPLQAVDQYQSKEPILVIARSMIARCRKDSASDSGVDLSCDTQVKQNSISGRVKWGHSPLAKYLIQDLFDHYERVADLQMLAMLSCVFSEPAVTDEFPQAELRLSQPQTPLSMKTPAFSLDYFPSDAAAWTIHQKTPYSSIGSTPRTSLTPVALYGSLGSSNDHWGSDPSASYSVGNTPPIRSARGSSDKLHQLSLGLSVSPDDPRILRRGNSGLTSSFANLAKPFSATAPSSPPSRKRPSPVEPVISTLTPSVVTWGNNTVLENVKELYHGHASYSDDDASRDDARPNIVTGMSISLFNQDTFDDEGCVSTPLLDHTHTARFSAYRKAYSELLYMWGLQLSRLEILKFDSLPDYFDQNVVFSTTTNTFTPSAVSIHEKSSVQDIPPASPIPLGRKEYGMQDRGLDITGYCLKHESRLEPVSTNTSPAPGGAVGKCERCNMIKSQLRCVICTEPVDAVYVPCLSCGCVSHTLCLENYHAAGETLCPGGCDCDCTQKAEQGVVESWEVMIGAIEMMRSKHHHTRRRDVVEADADKSDWDSARSVDLRSESGQSSGVKGYSTLSKRLGQVRNTEWAGGLRRKGGLLRKEDVS